MALLMDLPEYGTLKPAERRTRRLVMSRILGSMFDQALAVRNRWQVWWFITMAYLQGVRTITQMNYDEGLVEVNDADELDEFIGDNDSLVPFRWDSVMARRQAEIGRLLRLDIEPSVRKRTYSLQSLRNASTCQVLLDSLLSGSDLPSDKTELLTLLVDYGTVGLMNLDDQGFLPSTASGLHYGREVLPPWELIGVPGEIKSRCELRADGRSRWYPLAQLEKWPGLWWPDDDEWGLLDIQRLNYGNSASHLNISAGRLSGRDVQHSWSSYDKTAALRRRAKVNARPDHLTDAELLDEEFVQLRELFVHGPRQSLLRYIVMAGQWVLFDQSFMPGEVPLPISTATYDDIGQYYGRSFTGRIMPGGLRQERLLHRLLTNTSDFSKFGFMMVPMGQSIDMEAFKATGDPRIIPYEAAPDARRDPVQQITPVNSSDIPGRVAAMIDQGLDKLSMQGPLFQGQSAGRVESGEAYRTLAQTGSTHLLTTAASIRRMMSMHYRSALFRAFHELNTRPEGVQIALARIENHIAGIRIDQSTGMVTLDKSNIDVWDLDISIRSDDPVAGDTERDLAYRMYLDRTIKPIEFYILNYVNNWRYPVGARGLYENYVKAVLQNLRLFNDGEIPGVDVGYFPGTFDLAEVFLYATQEFCRSAEFDLASDAVKNAFKDRILKLMALQSGMLPAGMVPPDAAAAMSQQAPGVMQQPGTAGLSPMMGGAGMPGMPGFPGIMQAGDVGNLLATAQGPS